MSAAPGRTGSVRALPWSDIAFQVLAFAGAVTVIVGSYLPWATFYAGLIARDGVAGHGKYFIALAAVAVLAALASVSRKFAGVRWLVPAAGIVVAAVALRDLRNLDVLMREPAAAFYVPGKGDGLYVVLAGAALLVASFLVAPRFPSLRRDAIAPTLAAIAVIGAMGALVAGGYGEYYLHLGSGGHQQGHTDTLNIAHVLTFGGASVLIAAASGSMYLFGASRRR